MGSAVSISERKTAWVLFAAALAARLAALFANSHVLQEVLTFDPWRYDTIARHLLASGEYDFLGHKAIIAPLYPFFLAGIYSLPLPERLTVILLQIVLGALTVVLIYRIALHLFPGRTALAAGVVAALYPPYVFICIRVMTEALFLPLLAAGLLFTIRFAKGDAKADYLLSGLFTGLACLTRPLLFYFPPVMALGMLFFAYRRKQKLPFKGLALYLVLFYLCSVPWAVRNYFVLGSPVITSTSSGELLLISQMPRDGKHYGFNLKSSDLAPEDRYKIDLPELERSAALKQLAINYLKENPQVIPRIIMLKSMYLLSPFDWEVLGNTQGTFNPMFLLLVPLGIFGLLKSGTSQNRGIILGLLVYFLAFSFVTYSSPRLRLPLELPLIVFAGNGWVALEGLSDLVRKWRSFWVALLVILLVSGHIWSASIKSYASEFFTWLGLW